MARCYRCCLHKSMRIVNIIMSLFGVGTIVYSLWLQKTWDGGVAKLHSVKDLPIPWFIYTCLGVGISICFSTLIGHMVANCMNNSTLCIYIVTIFSLLLLEVAVIVAIFFKMDWSKTIAEYIDDYHEAFKSFVLFHIKMCQLISIMTLVPQINVIALAVILRAIGTEPTTHHNHDRATPDFTQSFLVESNPLIPEISLQTCIECESLLGGGSRHESFMSHVKDVFRMRFQRSDDS